MLIHHYFSQMGKVQPFTRGDHSLYHSQHFFIGHIVVINGLQPHCYLFIVDLSVAVGMNDLNNL